MSRERRAADLEKKVSSQYKQEAHDRKGGSMQQKLKRGIVGQSTDIGDFLQDKTTSALTSVKETTVSTAAKGRDKALVKTGIADTAFSGDWRALSIDEVGEAPLDHQSKEYADWEKRRDRAIKKKQLRQKKLARENKRREKEGLPPLPDPDAVPETVEEEVVEAPEFRPLDYEEQRKLEQIAEVEKHTAERDKKRKQEEDLAKIQAQDQDKLLQDLWDAFDEDGGGDLDHEEVRHMMESAMERELSEEEVDAAFKEMDADGSGEVDFDEFKGWWSTQGDEMTVHVVAAGVAAAERKAKREAEQAALEAEAQAVAAGEKEAGVSKRVTQSTAKHTKTAVTATTHLGAVAAKTAVKGAGTIVKETAKGAKDGAKSKESKEDRKERKKEELRLKKQKQKELKELKAAAEDNRTLEQKLADSHADDYEQKEKERKDMQKQVKEKEAELKAMSKGKGVVSRTAGMTKGVVSKTAGVTKGVTTGLVKSSVSVAVLGPVHVVSHTAEKAIKEHRPDFSSDEDEEPEMTDAELRGEEGFHSYFDKKVAAGTYDFDMLAPEMHKMTEEAVRQSMEEYRDILAAEKVRQKEERKAARKKQHKFDKSKKGKKLAQEEREMEAARMLQEAKEEQLRQAAEKEHLDNCKAEEKLRLEHMRINMNEPAERLKDRHDAQAELKFRTEEFSLWSEFKKDPYDPEGTYLEYLSRLSLKSKDDILAFWARMRLKNEIEVVDDGNGEDEEEDEEEDWHVPDLLVALVNTRIRAGFEADSEEIGILEVGEELEPLEKRRNAMDIVRVRFQRTEFGVDENDEPVEKKIDGWVNYTSSQGQAILQEVDKAPPPKKKKLSKKEKKQAKRKMKRKKKQEKAEAKAAKKKGAKDDEMVEDFSDLVEPPPDPELVARCAETPLEPTLHFNGFGKFTTDDDGNMEIVFEDETVIVPGGSIGGQRVQLEEVTVETLTLKKEIFPQLPDETSLPMQAALDCMEKAVKAEKEAEAERERVRDMKEKKRAREEENRREIERKKKEKKERKEREAEMARVKEEAAKEKAAEKKRKAEMAELKRMQKGWDKAREKPEPGIRSPYEIITELKEHCERYTEDFPLAWDRFVDVYHSNREKVVKNMQRSLQVCRLLPKLSERKRKLQHDMVESLINYEHDVAFAKFEGVNLDTEEARDDKVIEVVDKYLQQLGKFERKRFAALVKDGDMLLARKMATKHLHEYWREHSRISAGVYNWMFDLDATVQNSLDSIPRDTIDLFRFKLKRELDMTPDLTDEERDLPDPLDKFKNESDNWADIAGSKEDQSKSGHHISGAYAPDLPGCYWTGLFEGPDEMMMDKPMRKAAQDGSGQVGFLVDSSDGSRYWVRIRRGVMEFWNDELPERQQKLAHEDGRTDEGNFYIEREIVLLNIYTYVKVPEESAPHSIMIISGTLHVEEFECRGARAPMPFCAACSRATLSLATDERDVDAWIESIERARSWAVDQEEMRTFAGADGEDIDYEEFMEFQRKKAKEKAKQLSDLNKTQDRREREDDMAGTQHEEGIVRCPLPPCRCTPLCQPCSRVVAVAVARRSEGAERND